MDTTVPAVPAESPAVELPAPDARVIGAEVPDLHDVEVIDGQRTRLRVDGGWVYTTWGLTEDGLDVTNPSSVFAPDPAASAPAAGVALTAEEARFLGGLANDLILAGESPSAAKVRALSARLLAEGGDS